MSIPSLMATKTKNSAGSHLPPSSQRGLDRILNGDYQHVFDAQDFFSLDGSTGHVFDVIGGNGTMRSNVRGDKLAQIIKVS